MDCFVACAPLHKRFAFVAGNDAVANTAISPNSMTLEVMALSFVMAGLDPAIHVFLAGWT
jgi:hypothetical protein